MDRAKVDGEGRARYVQETRELTQGKVTMFEERGGN